MRAIVAALAMLFVASATHADAPSAVGEMQVLGYVEYVDLLQEEPLRLRARLDTGARTSSLNALDKKRFERDGKEWIAFDVLDPEDDARRIRYERPVVRNVRILRHDGEHQRRPVVEMKICLGNLLQSADVSLIDRTELTYQLLIGRRFLENRILVDSSTRLTTKPNCEMPEPEEDDDADEDDNVAEGDDGGDDASDTSEDSQRD